MRTQDSYISRHGQVDTHTKKEREKVGEEGRGCFFAHMALITTFLPPQRRRESHFL